MATILDNYRNLQNNYRSQIAANSLPLEDNLKMQEVNYRICVLETFESLSKSAPITMDTKVMRKVSRNARQPQRPLKRSCRTVESVFPASALPPRISTGLQSGIIS